MTCSKVTSWPQLQHLEYMAAGWEITSSHSGNLWLRLESLSSGPVASHRLEIDSVLRSIYRCQNEEGCNRRQGEKISLPHIPADGRSVSARNEKSMLKNRL